ncbi:MAG: hypothetical protein ACRYGO_09590 [Janthinobacterium lividum]
MAGQMEKPPKIGTEITVRISLTFQEAPDVHTLLAMTPVRERGKLVRLALERYIAETGHPAGDVEQQINAISTWLRSRTAHTGPIVSIAGQLEVDRTVNARGTLQHHDGPAPLVTRSYPAPAETIGRSDSAPEEVAASSSSIKRWLQV